MSTLLTIKAVIRACRGLLFVILANPLYSCCMGNGDQKNHSYAQELPSSLRVMQTLLRHNNTPRLLNRKKTADPLLYVSSLFYLQEASCGPNPSSTAHNVTQAPLPERLSPRIIYTPDENEIDDSSPEFTHRKAYGDQKYGRKAKKKDTCRAHKFIIGASHHSHTQKKKLHGQGSKKLEPLNLNDIIEQDIGTSIGMEERFELYETVRSLEAAYAMVSKYCQDKGDTCQEHDYQVFYKAIVDNDIPEFLIGSTSELVYKWRGYEINMPRDGTPLTYKPIS